MEQIDDQYTPADVESTVEAYWDDADAYESAREAHADDPPFFFVGAHLGQLARSKEVGGVQLSGLDFVVHLINPERETRPYVISDLYHLF